MSASDVPDVLHRGISSSMPYPRFPRSDPISAMGVRLRGEKRAEFWSAHADGRTPARFEVRVDDAVCSTVGMGMPVGGRDGDLPKVWTEQGCECLER